MFISRILEPFIPRSLISEELSGLYGSQVIRERIFKKKYRMSEGMCLVSEAVYDGCGSLIREITPERDTGLGYIPASVIINDGLTGDMHGESDVEVIADYERWYSKLAAADMDAERQGMNPIRYTIDVSSESTENLSLAAGAFWDLSTDNVTRDNANGKVGILENNMSYSGALATTLDRLRDQHQEKRRVVILIHTLKTFLGKAKPLIPAEV